jgi:hypothetical protein
MTDRAIHIHEDDCAMRALLPAAAQRAASDDIALAVEASVRNQAAGGGWTDTHIIAEPQLSFHDAGLVLADVDATLSAIMPRVRRFTATASAGFNPGTIDPFGSYETNAYCYGYDAGCYIKIDTDQQKLTQIWFECRTTDDEQRLALRRGLEAIDALAAAAIADYWLNCAGAVRDRAFLDRYFTALRDGD